MPSEQPAETSPPNRYLRQKCCHELFAEAAAAQFAKVRDDMMAKQEYVAASVARDAMDKFRELLHNTPPAPTGE